MSGTETEELRLLVDEMSRAALGFEQLRPLQQQAAAAVVSGTDALVVMPTGAGKSAVYQLAGPLRPGPTLVVSPLVALQADQVRSIGDGLGGAVAVNSTLSEGERAAAFAALTAGDAQFLFLAPEQLARRDTVDAIADLRPGLFVVDEAHCISAWGHDFRPDYLQLAAAVVAVGRPPVLALTATASPLVRDDIVQRLGMREPLVVVAGFERGNLDLTVVTALDDAAARAHVVEAACGLEGTGLVYVGRRQEAEDLAIEISEHRAAMAYHAGLPTMARDAVHERFLESEPVVIVATNAFGLGIDAPHVRWVVHATPPDSLDSYYQEIGRAGRDGAAARAVLCWVRGKAGDRRLAGVGASLDATDFTLVAAAVAGGAETVAAVEKATRVGRRRLLVAVDRLRTVGAIETGERGRLRWVAADADPTVAADLAHAHHEQHRRAASTRTEMLRQFLETSGCRWELLLAYFGQSGTGPCGHCDNCRAGRVELDPAPAAGAFATGAGVRHPRWGQGRVIAVEDDKLTVLFDEHGYRTLALDLVENGNLLELI